MLPFHEQELLAHVRAKQPLLGLVASIDDVVGT
jgi:hypothetical protein